MNREKVEEGKHLGEIESDFDIPEDIEGECPKCGNTLEWNGDCCECDYGSD